MNTLQDQFKNYETTALLEMFVSLSNTITALRDKPFCTIRQLEALEDELNLNRITFKFVYEELSSRQLSEEEQQLVASKLQ